MVECLLLDTSNNFLTFCCPYNTHAFLDSQGSCAERASTARSQHSDPRQLLICSNDGDPVKKTPSHVTTMTAIRSGHVIGQFMPGGTFLTFCTILEFKVVHTIACIPLP